MENILAEKKPYALGCTILVAKLFMAYHLNSFGKKNIRFSFSVFEFRYGLWTWPKPPVFLDECFGLSSLARIAGKYVAGLCVISGCSVSKWSYSHAGL